MTSWHCELPDWKDFANVFPFAVGGFFLFVGLMVLGEPKDARYAPILFLIAVLLFLTFIPLRKLGKTQYSLGIDGKTNTLWVYRKGRGIVGVEMNAHKITGFSFMDKRSFSINGTWFVNPSMPFLWHKREWLLTVYRAGAPFPFGVAGSGLAVEKEAREIVEKANAVLRPRRN